MTCNSSSFNKKEDPIGIMDWISEMLSAFLTCRFKVKIQITYFKRNMLGKILSPILGKMLELENQFMAFTNGSISVDDYTNSFIAKMEFTLRLVPDELSKIDGYAKGYHGNTLC